MHKGRLEAFSDGVIAILITIMVLELKVPHGDSIDDLLPLWPVVLSYVLSFIYLGIYWNNHHHLMQASHHVNGPVLWANLHLLFWLSLIPFATAWMGENHFAAAPVALYGGVLLAAARLLPADRGPATGGRLRFAAGPCRGPRTQGAHIAGALCAGPAAGLRHPRPGLRAVWGGCRDVADPGPTHRTRIGRVVSLPSICHIRFMYIQ
jgi:hypothetical protein